MTIPCRLLIDPPAEGAWNMAVDETLLRTAANLNVATLRFYRWAEPTLSLGYFQSYSDRELHAASHSCRAVRRPSGGGAILHDRELTYSLALPAVHPLPAAPNRLYERVHEAVASVLRTRIGAMSNLETQIHASSPADGPEPFLCFQRRGRGDVILYGRAADRSDNWKVAGSAQRRWRGAVLQHGSVLLAASPFAPELLGIGDLVGKVISAPELTRDLTAQLRRDLGLSVKPQAMTAAEVDAVECLAAEKFTSSRWTNRR